MLNFPQRYIVSKGVNLVRLKEEHSPLIDLAMICYQERR